VAQRFYATLLFLPYGLTPWMAWLADAPTLMLPLLLLPASRTLWHDFLRCPPGLAFNQVLFRTFRMELVFAVLLACGAVLDRLWGH
jgi:1,4-dihydroxy-2-naphthoate octaprenyltransferase